MAKCGRSSYLGAPMGTLIDLFISEASKLPQKPTWYRASARVMTWERSGAEAGSPCRASSSSMEQGAELYRWRINDRHWMLERVARGHDRVRHPPALAVHGADAAVDAMAIAGGSTRHEVLSPTGWAKSFD